jgi:two-component system alkaline phosphatase synthesis response regulator PhoP
VSPAERPGAPAAGSAETVARILLVDDVRRLVDVMRSYLRRTTCRILTARNGPEAIRVCRQERPDIVFLDAGMPGSGGAEVCRTLKTDALLRSIPVVIVAPRDRFEECTRAGCDDVIAKPITQEQFLAKVRRFVALLERGEKRIPASVRVTFQALAGAYTAYTKDLSPHGLFLKTERPFAPGTRLRMTIHLPGQRGPVAVEGEVRRVVEPSAASHLLAGVGVRFVDPETAVTRAIETFIAGRLAR